MSESRAKDDGPGLLEAVAIAQKAHDGQCDQNGFPYVAHCLRMAEQFHDKRQKIVALLHDVPEKGPGWSLSRLRRFGFDKDILAAVNAMTRCERETEDEFVLRALQNPLARDVKLADLRDNLRQALETGRNPAKYRRGLDIAEDWFGWEAGFE